MKSRKKYNIRNSKNEKICFWTLRNRLSTTNIPISIHLWPKFFQKGFKIFVKKLDPFHPTLYMSIFKKNY